MNNVEIKQAFDNAGYSRLKDLFDAYTDFLPKTHKPYSNSCFSETVNTINVFAVRCNPLYITNDMTRNNDVLCVLENRADDNFRRYVYDVTADPKTQKPGIANLLPQIYLGNIRNHRSILGRPAICQDNMPVWVRRYNANNEWYEERGYFGINIHDTGGFRNSSLGCIILANDSDYKNEYKPLLLRVSKNNIPVAVFQDEIFEKLYNAV